MHMAFKGWSGTDMDISGYLFSYLVFILSHEEFTAVHEEKSPGVQRDLQAGELSPGASITTHYTLPRDSALTRGVGFHMQPALADLPSDRVGWPSAAWRLEQSLMSNTRLGYPAAGGSMTALRCWAVKETRLMSGRPDNSVPQDSLQAKNEKNK